MFSHKGKNVDTERSEKPRFRIGAGILISFALWAATFLYGVAVGHYEVFPFRKLLALHSWVVGHTPGRWERMRPGVGPSVTSRGETAQIAVTRETAEELATLGYVGGYVPASDAGGTKVMDGLVNSGALTLYCSGHAPIVDLITPDGEVVHRWEIPFEEVWSAPIPFDSPREHEEFVRRAHVFPNGDLLIMFEYIGIAKIDKDSKVLWKVMNRAHHDFSVAADGSIVGLVQRTILPQELESDYPGFASPPGGISDDLLVVLDSSGNERARVSIFDAFYRSEYAPVLDRAPEHSDMFHANSVSIVNDQEQTLFGEGEVLISLRNIHSIISIDVKRKRVTWILSGKWRMQHQASLLDNGNILLLDNHGGNRDAPFKHNRSEVLEIDPKTQEVVWRYAGSDESPLFTHYLGYVERLADGNTLISESTQGRILEVTPDGDIVWEFLNPQRAGKEKEYIATVMGAQRVPVEALDFFDG